MEFFKKYHRKIITTLIIVFSIGFMFSPIFGELPFVSDNSTKLETIALIGEILSAIFVLIGTVIAVWQYYVSSKSKMISMETEKVQKAIDLSKYYKDEVLYYYSIVRQVYIDSGIAEILNRNKDKMINFDAEEMNDIFTDSEIKEIAKLFSSETSINTIAKLNEAFDLKIEGCRSEITVDEEGKRVMKLEINGNKLLNIFHTDYITKVLNNIEHFAMYFTHNVADESVIYQSLYPTYIEMCRMMYYDISKCSEIGKPKLYRNLQKLYTIWVKREKENKAKIRKHENTTGTIPQNLR